MHGKGLAAQQMAAAAAQALRTTAFPVKPRTPLFWLVVMIAVGTVAAGLVQLFWPCFVLERIGGPTTGPVCYFFSIIGMFMAIVGGLALHALFDRDDHPIIFLWATIQKLGAAAAVGLGVRHGTFGTLALAVAAFDLVSGILMMTYGSTLQAGEREPRS